MFTPCKLYYTKWLNTPTMLLYSYTKHSTYSTIKYSLSTVHRWSITNLNYSILYSLTVVMISTKTMHLSSGHSSYLEPTLSSSLLNYLSTLYSIKYYSSATKTSRKMNTLIYSSLTTRHHYYCNKMFIKLENKSILIKLLNPIIY